MASKHGGLAAAFLSLAVAAAAQVYEDNLPSDHPAIRYWQSPLDDRLTRLKDRLESGADVLVFTDGRGYLPSVLEHLDVGADSQTLVFSKTSLQKLHISPRTPRAIYFNDDVAVGFVPGGDVIELAAIDPRQGAVFYTLANRKTDRPRLERSKICLACHQDAATLGVPGLYVGSVFTTPSGRPSYRGSIVTDHRTPFADRWGGWYVTGAQSLSHRGNAVGSGPADERLTPLPSTPDETRYLTTGSSVVALMTLEHQTQVTNLMIRLAWEARLDPNAPALEARTQELVRYMLFADEVPLPAPIPGDSQFVATFPRRGPRDGKGRSLRDFDLETRLFTYPLTYMVYSDLFASMPESVREGLGAELYRGLSDAGSSEDRRAVLEILRGTHEALPRWLAEAFR